MRFDIPHIVCLVSAPLSLSNGLTFQTDLVTRKTFMSQLIRNTHDTKQMQAQNSFSQVLHSSTSNYLDTLSEITLQSPINSPSATTTSSAIVQSSTNINNHIQHDRRPIVAGNWKLNPSTKEEAIDLLTGLKKGLTPATASSDILIFPPLPYLSDALSILQGTGVQVGAQNAGSYEKGAFTGETAPSMLASAGCSYVLLGHSERRSIFGETDEAINDRVKACLDQPTLRVVLCVGETLEEYEAGLLKSVVDAQLRKGLADVKPSDLLAGRIIIAYEPVWAIGTGLVATPEQAQIAHIAIRDTLRSAFPHHPDISSSIRIQYGGSVSPDTARDLMSMPDVDGALVGGASLSADSFIKIIEGSTPTLALPPTTSSSIVLSSESEEHETPSFFHKPISYFDIDKLTSKGPRKNADVGEPHDSTRPLGSDGPLSSGSWWCAEGGWPSLTPRTTSEVFYVLTGNGCVTDMDGTKHIFGPGDLVILPKGWYGRWDVLNDIHKIWFVTSHDDIPGADITPIIMPYSQFAQQHLVSQGILESVTRGSPWTSSQYYHDTIYMKVGVWSCTPGSFSVSNDETIVGFHVLEGEFFMTESEGSGISKKCVAGDTVLLPKDWKGYFDVIQSVKKIWVLNK